ncbi:MAG: hypothetical protein ACJASL_001269 [Paraglaciecola sp.]|jgi:hypothetical protein
MILELISSPEHKLFFSLFSLNSSINAKGTKPYISTGYINRAVYIKKKLTKVVHRAQ